MSRLAQRMEQIRDESVHDVARLVWRKAIYRKVRMGRYGYFAIDGVPPLRPCDFPIEIWGPGRFSEILGTNDQISQEDIELFSRHRSSCIVALDEDRIVASSWMLSGEVFVKELGRTFMVPLDEHFSCRSWVSPEFRGRSLFSHMVYHYTRSIPPGDEVWGFVYYWNAASIRSLSNIGWKLSGDYWTSHVLGKRFSGEKRFPPRPAFEGDDVVIP